MPETNSAKPELQTGLTPEQKLALTGISVAVRTDVWEIWTEAMADGPEVVEARISSVVYDIDGNPVAVGVKRHEMLRHIELHGDPSHNSARMVGTEPDREVMFTADGKSRWPVIDLSSIFQIAKEA